MTVTGLPAGNPMCITGMKVFSARGGNVSSVMGRLILVSALSVTWVAVYASLLASMYASFWKCRISQRASVAFLFWSSRHHRYALYPLAASDTAHAIHPYHSMPLTLLAVVPSD